MTKSRIFLSAPHMGGAEQKYVNEAFDTNWISPVGPNLQAFEESISKYHGGGYHVAALSSGTAAIHLALILLGVERGDEVICSTFTFSGTCNPIMYQGATPVFVDSEKDTWNMNPEALEEAIKDRQGKGKKVKAIIPVHLYGMPANMPEIMKIAREYEIPVIEDAAEALGASIKGKKTGTFGDLAIFSFNGNKIITTSGGGALMSEDIALVEKAKFLATQARDQAPHYQHSTIGYNYRLSNISAGIGRGQMEVLDERINQRRSVNQWYKENFSDKGFDFLTEPEGYFSNYWLTTALLDGTSFDREELRIELEKENIEARPLWKPMHLQPVFKGYPYYGDKTSEYLFEKGVCLPSCSSLDEEEKERIFQTIVRFL
ncbi:aminotransferase class I/II-fold pyridoxal phosphate-dependent enzyme [Mangrovivirga sp. M17]|uniref:Aminotransferase class I/II-fold pyridoxal phosphate-dependent enzyme n=1 Tax=Mangrovivirga halotolerans TaxID=2993936 RepID=A0ABT3RTV4_9BACT|nr:aminotransferase class I/II-fold pyridoxal phosphate-dependent enzyme [Mangrovivirga halotolerans]MCX2745217.1 aminotransferase class I/II-fold pyridoxal phosphate-dependent enzyme [Mangrovivirga halotolerans]